MQLKDKSVDQLSGDVEPWTTEFNSDNLKEMGWIDRRSLRGVRGPSPTPAISSSDNRTAKIVQQGPQGVHQASIRSLLSRS